MLAHCDNTTLVGKRDKVLLLINFAGAFQRSEMGALTMDDVFVTDVGSGVNVRQPKVIKLPFSIARCMQLICCLIG